MKRIIIFLFVILLFNFSVSATSQENFYNEQYELSGADELDDYIPDETKDFLYENNIDPKNYNWANNLTAENVFEHIWDFVKSGATTPLKSGAVIMSVILVTAMLSSAEIKGGAKQAALYASALSCAAVIIAPVYSIVTASTSALKGVSVFMLGFIPVFAVIIAAAGGAATSVSMSALLMTATQGVSYISNFIILPLTSGYLAISITSSVSPSFKNAGITESIKKIVFWIISLISTVFLGILSIQTVVNSAADNLAMKTAKFIVGSSVPVAGSVLSEALGTVTASMGLLKSSVGIYGTVVLIAILLPLIIELLIWRVVLMVSSIISELFSVGHISGLLKSIDSVLAILIGIILLTSAMFIISLSVVITAGKQL